MRTLDFRDHRRELDDNRYVYAVVSRRSRGLSIGLNLTPDKVCNFDCPYCQVDRTPGGHAVDPDRLESELAHLLGLARRGSVVGPPSTPQPHIRASRTSPCWRWGADPRRPSRRPSTRHPDNRPPMASTGSNSVSSPTLPSSTDPVGKASGPPRGRGRIGASSTPVRSYFHIVDGTTLPFQRVLDNLRDAGRARAHVHVPDTGRGRPER